MKILVKDLRVGDVILEGRNPVYYLVTNERRDSYGLSAVRLGEPHPGRLTWFDNTELVEKRDTPAQLESWEVKTEQIYAEALRTGDVVTDCVNYWLIMNMRRDSSRTYGVWLNGPWAGTPFGFKNFTLVRRLKTPAQLEVGN